MKTLSLIVLLLAPTFAQAADDAPVTVPLTPGFTCIPDAQRIGEGKAMASCSGELADIKKGTIIVSPPAFIGIIAGVAVVAAVIAVGVLKATEAPR